METTATPQFIQLSEQVKMSPATSKIFKAMALAQGEMGSAPENAKNPHFGSSYADLESVINTAKPILAKNGLAVWQMPIGVPPFAKVGTLISHESGEWIYFELTLRPTKDDPQGHGSSISYARRYSEEAVLNMATKDDDGNSASVAPSGNMGTPNPTPKAPIQPNPGPVLATAYPLDHMITFGKFKGSNVNQVPRDKLQSYLEWMLREAQKSGKPLSRDAQVLMDKIDELTSQNYKTGGARQDGPPEDMFSDIPF